MEFANKTSKLGYVQQIVMDRMFVETGFVNYQNLYYHAALIAIYSHVGMDFVVIQSTLELVRKIA